MKHGDRFQWRRRFGLGRLRGGRDRQIQQRNQRECKRLHIMHIIFRCPGRIQPSFFCKFYLVPNQLHPIMGDARLDAAFGGHLTQLGADLALITLHNF